MPKIQVNERDLSWYYRQRDPGQLVVLMPGVSNFGPDEPTLVDENNFVKTFGYPISPYDTSYQMALSFVKTGINVLFWRQSLPGEETASATLTTDTINYTYSPADGDVIDTNNDPITDSQGQGNSIIFFAKYPGKFGNHLFVKYETVVSEPQDPMRDLRRLSIYYDKSLVETLFINYDPSSPYYYDTAIKESAYIKVEVAGDPSLVSDTTDLLELKGGSDGDTFTSKEDLVSAVVSSLDEKLSEFKEELADPYSYDFNIAISAGFSGAKSNLSEISNVDGKFVDLCTKKGTAIYFVDGSEDMSPEDFYTYTGLSKFGTEGDLISFNTSYAAATGPWMNSVLMSNGAIASLPGSYAQLISWGQSVARGTPLWMAPAGVKRASLSGIVKSGSTYEVGAAILDMWQNHEKTEDPFTDHGINPIMKLKQYGYVIYGNSTLLQTRWDSAGGKTTSMLQSLSTRVVSNMIKSQAFNVSLQLQFDQIDDDLFAEFKTLMTVFMDQLKYGGALYDYEIVADRSVMTLDDLNSRTIPVLIRISPNPAAENFIINLEISQAGVTFGGDSTEDTVTE